MNPSTFISPRNYQAPGGIPRRLLGGVLVVVVLVAMSVYWIASGRHEAPRSSDVHRSVEARSAEAQPRGSSHSVDEAADRAVAEARRTSASTAAASSPGAAPVEKLTPTVSLTSNAMPIPRVPSGRPSDPLESWPTDGQTAAVGPAARQDPGASAREMDARSAETRVFDEPAVQPGEGDISATHRIGPLSWPSSAAALTAMALDTSSRTGSPSADVNPAVQVATDTLRHLAPPGNRDLAQREEGWQERAGQGAAVAPLIARPAAGALVIEEGTVIPAVLTRRIDSDTPGVVTAMVSIDVYDTRTARTRLLPKGSRLVGRYNNDVSAGQDRLQCAFTRLILPDGSSFDLPGAIGSDALGQAGLPADIDRHFLQRFGSALLIGVIADRVVSPRAVPSNNAYGGGLSATGQVLVNTADAELHRNESIAPTLTVPEGTRLNVEVVRDMVFSQPIPEHS
jgi:type IV secretion system protein VirB10